MAAARPEHTLPNAFTRPADRDQFALAVRVVAVLAALFVAAVPFATVPLQPLPAFVPTYQSVLIVNDLITAAFMFGQAHVSRSRALLVLATGYVFTAFAAIVHLLTFPGVFSPTGLLGAGQQTTAWLYMFWHAGFPLFVIGYAVVSNRPAREMPVSPRAIAGCTAAALSVVFALALLATAGAGGLPAIMRGNHYAPAFTAVISTVVALIVIAAGTLWLRRPRTVLDLWLLVVLCAWLFDVALSAALNAGRFDLGFYVGRLYGLLAASFVLGVLIIEHLGVYRDLVKANATALRHTEEMVGVAAEKATREEKARVDEEAAGKLRESEDRFRTLADNIAQLAWMADESGSLFWYNHRWYEYTGTTLDEMKGWGWQSVHDPAHLPRVIDKFRAHVAAAEPWEDTFPLRARDGLFRWFLSRAVPIRGADGRVRLWFGTNTDITEQRLAQEALATSEERFRQLSDAMPQLVWTSDAAGLVDYYNQRASEYAGLERIGDGSWAWRGLLHEDDVETTAAAWSEAVARSTIYEIEHRLKMRDGSFRWHLSRALPTRDASGAIVRWFGTATDIDAHKKAEEALRRADRMKNAFIATLAHELRNPLAPILNAVEILRLTTQTPPGGGRPVEIIDNQVHHLVRLVDDLLDVSRITLGKIALRRERLDLRDVIREAVEASRPILDVSRHRLNVEIGDAPIVVEGDRVRLAQVVSNLLNNAARYTPADGAVTISAVPDGDDAVISVEDNGVGIPSEMLDRIFDAFVQVEHGPERMRSGLGIGLSLVKNLVDLHGGSVSAESAGVGRGSRFSVRLPRVTESEEEPVHGLDPETRPERRISFLVVDDNEDAATTQQILLTAMGHEAHCALGGPAALRLASAVKPEVVLLDLGMPGMDGYEVARRLRELPETRDAVIIAQTGWGQAEDHALTRKAGFDAHLTKPVDIQRVLQVATQCMEDRAGVSLDAMRETGG